MNNDPYTNPTNPAPVQAPENTPPMPTQEPTPLDAPQPKRSKRFLVSGIVAGALVLLAGGSALGYTMWYQNPNKVVHDALLNSIQAKSSTLTGTASYKAEGVAVDLTFDGNGSGENGDFTVKADVAIDTPELKQDFTVNGSGRMIDGTLYFKLSGVKSLIEDMAKDSGEEIPLMTMPIVDKIEDQWISINPSDYEDINAELSRQQTCLTDTVKKIQSDKTMSNEVMDLYREHQIVTIEEELGSKNVNGVGSLGYRIDLDQEAAANFARGLSDTSFGKELKNCNDDIDFNEIADDIAEEREASEYTLTAELWVSRLGHEITEFSMHGNTGENETLNFTLQPTFNTEVAIEAPENSISIEALLEDIYASMMEGIMQDYSSEDFMIDGSSPNFQLSA